MPYRGLKVKKKKCYGMSVHWDYIRNGGLDQQNEMGRVLRQKLFTRK
jgi:hypothetical protein